MEAFLTSLLPITAHMGVFGYWLILFVSLLESLAFVGVIIPGTVIVIFAGFLAAEGYLELGDLIWFSALGAILGDSLSYWIGTRGTRFFRNENKILKLSHIEKGERFFKKHGNKSVFLGRFIGPLRATVPFIAGLSKMNAWSFLVWNIVSAFLWATLNLLIGYFFGGVAENIKLWTTRAGFFVLGIIAFFAILWFIVKKGAVAFSFVRSVARSVKNAILSNPEVRKLVQQYPGIFTFIERRLHRGKFSGLPLTCLFFAFIYILSLFLGIIEDVLASDTIVTFDVRAANFFLEWRTTELVTFFSWITLLGDVHFIIAVTVLISLLLWLWRKRTYIFPLWLSIVGSELFTIIGKIIIHRPRPSMAFYTESGFSFPSGHATIAVAFYGFLAYIFFRESKQWSARANIIFAGLFIIIAIGLSRLYLDVHYVSDVWAGYLVGLLWLIVGITVCEWIRQKIDHM